MKSIVFVFIFTISLVYALPKFRFGRKVGGNLQPPPTWKPTRAYRDQWYVQKLDHFNESDTRTWRQRYLVDEQYFSRNSTPVVYLFMGGEGEISSYWMTDGNWLQTAKDSHALLFQLEHRYYGMSQPFDDLSTPNLKYLSSRQALADAADFVKAKNEEYQLSATVRWIAFGGSYSGSLVAWFRLLYPDLVHGVVASSAPLLAQLDFAEYLKIVANGLAIQSQECVDRVQEGTIQLQEALDNLGSVDLNELLNLCDPIEDKIDNPKNVAYLMEAIADTFAGVAQYNNYAANSNLATVCDLLLEDTSNLTALESLGAFIRGENWNCLDYKYDSFLQLLRNINSSSGGAMRQWVYQTCTEFAFFQTSSGIPQVFGDRFDLEFFTDICVDAFGPEFNANFTANAVNATNDFYNGTDINMERVFYYNGGIDPWHALGILATENENSVAVFINDTSHCQDMYTPNAVTDSTLLFSVKQQEQLKVSEWISSPNKTSESIL